MTFFKIKYSFKFVILSIFLALLLTIIPIMGLKNKDVYILIMHCYGTLNVNLIDKIYPITFWILPQIIVLSIDRKSTRLNSSHANISYAVFCLKKKNIHS